MHVNILGLNKCEIVTDKGRYLQSYKTVVAFVDNAGRIVLFPKWNYSRTTTKHVSQFLGIPAKEIRKRIGAIGKERISFLATNTDAEFKING